MINGGKAVLMGVCGKQMGKQGLGVYATSYRQRFDTVAHVLHYPQRPLVTTKTAELIGRDLPNGQNAIVAIMCFSGYNQGKRSLLVSINAMHVSSSRV